MEQEEQSEHQTKENSDSSIIDISSMHLNQTDVLGYRILTFKNLHSLSSCAIKKTESVINLILQKENETHAEANTEIHEQNIVQDPPTCFGSPEKVNKKTWLYQQVKGIKYMFCTVKTEAFRMSPT